MKIALVNYSTSQAFSNADLDVIARGIMCQIGQDFLEPWGLREMPLVTALQSPPQVEPAGSVVVRILDDSGQSGALGLHDETPDGEVVSEIYANPILSNGGGVLEFSDQNPVTLSTVISHEILELVIDPYANLWAEDNGTEFALEVCDPVEGFSYYKMLGATLRVAVSDFVTPQWFDPRGKSGGKFDYLGKCTGSFQLAKNGYAIVRTAAQDVADIWGQRVPWKSQVKKARRRYK